MKLPLNANGLEQDLRILIGGEVLLKAICIEWKRQGGDRLEMKALHCFETETVNKTGRGVGEIDSIAKNGEGGGGNLQINSTAGRGSHEAAPVKVDYGESTGSGSAISIEIEGGVLSRQIKR